jgi:hypothetical protein
LHRAELHKRDGQGGADRSSRLRRETNVRKEDQPKAVPLNL